ncbi:hypothetical protein GT037_000376 [Alternaria burnsii]|uniref:Uncharacterized protein n=1 Tax=Alternaria burnsii TaxID=1187904 RepID=A0A8H7EKF6_9PLEO|nr:uncharacterized protein GT037_000376 [Alternaria burnsii]KAF7681400.1 hypothetical protein GT037_000376 [Alternaria burnsii]
MDPTQRIVCPRLDVILQEKAHESRPWYTYRRPISQTEGAGSEDALAMKKDASNEKGPIRSGLLLPHSKSHIMKRQSILRIVA